MNHESRITNKGENGFTILYAVLVGGLTLTIGVAIFNITLRQINLSSAGRESQFAFYAADSGTECAFYEDLNNHAFPTSTARTSKFKWGNTISCNDGEIQILPMTLPLSDDDYDEFNATSTFTVYWDAPMSALDSPSCSIVTVIKNDPDRDGLSSTKVESRGINDCVDLNNPGRVERAIRVRY